jgi:hypothetical protein
MANTPVFPATPRMGIVALTSNTLTTVLSAGNSGSYIEKLRYACTTPETVSLLVYVSDGSNDCLIATIPLSSTYGSIDLDFAIPSGTSIKVKLSNTPANTVYVSVFGGDY